MPVASVSGDIDRGDLQQAVAFAQRCFDQWHERGVIRADAHQAITNSYSALRSSLEDGGPVPDGLLLRSADLCWSCKQPLTAEAKHCDECGATARTTETHKLRYFIFVCFEIKKFQQAGILPLSAADACLMESNEHIAALRRYLDRERIPMVEVAEPSASRSATAPPRQPRRNLMEILLDPRNIHMLLAFGGALMVVGLVILLWVNEFFKPPVVAVGLGVVNAALLAAAGGCCAAAAIKWPAGPSRSLACLVMPLNLWYYHANSLITLDGHLWVAALVISVLYAASALVLRDELFVYIFTAGVTLTGLLFLADLPPSPEKFWEIAPPATLLVVLGLLAIHAERAFPRRTGRSAAGASAWPSSGRGHALLAAGLLLVLGAEIAGDWLYQAGLPKFMSR